MQTTMDTFDKLLTLIHLYTYIYIYLQAVPIDMLTHHKRQYASAIATFLPIIATGKTHSHDIKSEVT